MSTFTLMKSTNGNYNIVEVGTDNKPTMVAVNMNNTTNYGHVLPDDFIEIYTKLDHEIKPIELLAEEAYGRVQTFVTDEDEYFIVHEGVIRHPNCNADGAIRALYNYVKFQ